MTLLMYFLLLLIVGALLFLLASLVFGRGEELAAMHPDVAPVALPTSRPVVGADLRRMRLSVVVRGYRMSEVDWVLDEVAVQLDTRDREIERLRGERDRALQAVIAATPPTAGGADAPGSTTDGPEPGEAESAGGQVFDPPSDLASNLASGSAAEPGADRASDRGTDTSAEPATDSATDSAEDGGADRGHGGVGATTGSATAAAPGEESRP